MMNMLWLLLFATAVAFGWLIRRNLRNWRELQRAEEARFESFMLKAAGTPEPPAPAGRAPPAAATAPPAASAAPALATAAAPGNGLAQQKLLFDAAHKAGEAGEPLLAIQLYARLLARDPATSFAEPARAAVAGLRQKVVKS